jgi:hypothetical protein
VFLPVLIAAVFLTIIGVSVGLALGARARDRAAQAPARTPGVAVTSAAPSADRLAAPSAATGPSAAARPCPEETQRESRRLGAQGRLVVRRHILTGDPGATRGVSDVYVCADARGELYYHAKSGDPAAPWIEGTNAILLGGVRQAGGVYVATSESSTGAYTYEVFADRLRITRPGGEPETQHVRR